MDFRDLKEAQILALAITAEEEDARIYRDFANALRADFPATAELFSRMAEEEDGHRHRLIDVYRARFGEHIPLIRRQDVKGFILRRPSWLMRTLRPEKARAEAALMEIGRAASTKPPRSGPPTPASGSCSAISRPKSAGTKRPPRR